jgi:hypothetical protein
MSCWICCRMNTGMSAGIHERDIVERIGYPWIIGDGDDLILGRPFCFG